MGVEMKKEQWLEGTHSEVEFWSAWVKKRGGRWPRDFVDRLDTELPLRGKILELVNGIESEVISILDCGAGPLTILGKTHPTKNIKITAIDALAHEYQKLDFPFQPPVLTEFCETEHLLDRFPKDSFDISYARNTLDHSYDPVACIMNMIEVTRPNGYIYIQHSANEAEHEKYQGMHQWNFCIENNSLVIWNKSDRFNMTDLTKALVCVDEMSANGSMNVDIVFKKI